METRSQSIGGPVRSSRTTHQVGTAIRGAPHTARYSPPPPMNKDPWLTWYTVSTMNKLHAIVYPIICMLTTNPTSSESAFTKRWQYLSQSNHRQAMKQHMTGKQLQLCLDILDLSQYKDFVMQCLNIHNHIHKVTHKNAIEASILTPKYQKSSTDTNDGDTASTVLTDTTTCVTRKICYENGDPQGPLTLHSSSFLRFYHYKSQRWLCQTMPRMDRSRPNTRLLLSWRAQHMQFG